MDTMLYAEGREKEVDESVRQGLPYIAALLVTLAGVGLLWHLARRKPARMTCPAFRAGVADSALSQTAPGLNIGVFP